MKKIIQRILNEVLRGLNLLLSYEQSQEGFSVLKKIKSSWIKSGLKQCGTAFFNTPMTIKGAEFISIGNKFSSEVNLRLEAWSTHLGNVYTPEIIIGDNVSFSINCHVGAINRIIIEDNVLIGSNVFITDHSHGNSTAEEQDIPPKERKLYSKGAVIIKANVWIGENVTILPGVTIGRSSIIAANSVVTKDVPSNVIAAGNPAKIMKTIT